MILNYRLSGIKVIIILIFFLSISFTAFSQTIKIYPPLLNTRITSAFGMRFHPYLHHTTMHQGVDLKANFEPVHAFAAGMVLKVGHDPRSGNYIVLIHLDTLYETVYCHLSKVLVETGSFVPGGSVIGISGSTGMSTGPHLHFAIKKAGNYINPASVLKYLNQTLALRNEMAVQD